MTIILNGTTGITNDGGYTGDGVVFADTTPANTLVTTAAGNVGIGTSSPQARLNVFGPGVGGSTQTTLMLTHIDGSPGSQSLRIGAYQSGASVSGGAYLRAYYNYSSNTATSLAFLVDNGSSAIEAGRFDSSGNLLVGTTTQSANSLVTVRLNNAIALRGSSGTDCGGANFVRSDNNAKAWGITCNGSDFYITNGDFSRYTYLQGQNSFTSWSFASDRRIKKNIADLTYGLDSVLALKPREFDYINNDQHDIGFIAQELKEIIPEAVSGEEMPYADEDTPQERAKKTLGVAKDTLIPVLVKAIQEQQAIILAQESALTALTARVSALEGAQHV